MSGREYRDDRRDRVRDRDRERGSRYDDRRDGDRDRDRGRGGNDRDHGHGQHPRHRDTNDYRDRGRDQRSDARDRDGGRTRDRSRDRQENSTRGPAHSSQDAQEDDQPPPTSTSSTGWDGKAEAENDPAWARIYITNLPKDATTDELQELFGQLGVVAREKQKRGYKDQWPFKIKIYTDDNGVSKGDAVLTYEDANAARSAPGFFDGALIVE